jgi:hypothetical protein
LRAFGAETKKLATDIRAGGDAGGVLRGQLEQIAGQFNNAKSEVTGLTAALRDHKTGLEGVKDSIGGMVSPITGAIGGLREIAEAAGVAFVVERIAAFASEMAELGERTLNASAALGLSVPRYAQLASALQLAGADAQTAERALERLAVSLVEATGNSASKAAVAFRNIGVSQTELVAMSKDLGVALDVLAAKFADAEAGPARTAAASDILSRRLLDALIPALRRGAEGMEELKQKSAPAADQLAKTAPLADDTKEKLNLLAQASSTAAQSLFGTLKPAIDAIISGLTALISKLTSATAGIRDLIRAGSVGMLEDWRSGLRTSDDRLKMLFQGSKLSELTTSASAELPPLDVKAKRPVGTERAGGSKGGRGRAGKAETDDSEAIALERIGNEEKVDDLILDRRKQLIEAAAAAGKISLASEYQQLVDNLEQKRQADQNYY